MSSSGNRSNPSETRISDHRESDQAHVNASGKPDMGRQGGATHRESRNHNHPGQRGHKPQQHGPEQEKR